MGKKEFKQELLNKFQNSKKWHYFYDKKGKLRRVPKKQTTVAKIQKEAEKAEFGKQVGALKAKKRIPITDRLEELLWAKLEQIDPIKLLALAGATVFLHDVFLNASDIVEKVKLFTPSGLIGTITGGFGALETVFSDPSGLLKWGYETVSPFLPEQYRKKATTRDELTLWLLSFIVAYMLIYHGAEIASMFVEGGKSVVTLAAALLAAPA